MDSLGKTPKPEKLDRRFAEKLKEKEMENVSPEARAAARAVWGH